MINKKKSIVVYGAPGCGSNYIARELGEKTGMSVIPVQRLARLGKAEDLRRAERSVTITMGNLQRELQGYQDRLDKDNGLISGFSRIGLKQKIKQVEKQIAWYQTTLSSLQRDQQLRAQYPTVPNIYDLGYDRDTAIYLRDQYGDRNEEVFYEKQFMVDFVKELYKNVDGACVLDFGHNIPATLTDRIDSMKQKLDNGQYVAWAFGDGFKPENLAPEKTDELFEGFGTVANLQLPDDYRYTRYYAYINPLTQEYMLHGGYDRNATINIDTTNLFEENVTAVVNTDAARQVTYNRAKSNAICKTILAQDHVQGGGQGQQ